MENTFISIIVPVYNVEKYLKKCIESIRKQTFKQFEVILIDDGSTDSCGKICDGFAKLDNRIRVIHKKNGGLMEAWITGLKESNTDYIIFVDSDDWIAPRMFERLWENHNLYQADMVICNMCKVENKIKYRNKFIVETGYYNRADIHYKLYPVILNAGGFQLRGIPTSRCGKLIKKELLQNNLKYCDTRVSFAEDLNIIFPILLDCNSLVVIDDDKSDYFYRMNPSSILHSYNKTMYKEIQLVYKKLFQALKDKKKEKLEHQLVADYLAAIVQCYKNELMNRNGFSEVKQNITTLCMDRIFLESVNTINWKKYRRLNVLIIYVMSHWNIINRNIITFILYELKYHRMKILERFEKSN